MSAMSTSPRTSTLAVGTMVLLTALYFAQGLPYGFFSQAVPVILREEGYSLTQISVYGLLFAPWGAEVPVGAVHRSLRDTTPVAPGDAADVRDDRTHPGLPRPLRDIALDARRHRGDQPGVGDPGHRHRRTGRADPRTSATWSGQWDSGGRLPGRDDRRRRRTAVAVLDCGLAQSLRRDVGSARRADGAGLVPRPHSRRHDEVTYRSDRA